jgi:hypothetical protein
LLGALVMLLAAAGLAGAEAGSGGPTGRALSVHANAGSAGWMTLWILALALGMIRGDGAADGDGDGARGGYWLAWLAVAAVAANACAQFAGSASVSAGTATAVLLISACYVGWLVRFRQRTRAAWTVPRLGAAAALAVLMTGFLMATFGAWAAVGGHFGAAASLDAAQSAATAVPFVMLSATAAVEWAAESTTTAGPMATAGLVQVGAFVLAAAATIAGVLSSNLALTEANTSLVLAGIAIFAVRVGPRLLTAGPERGSRVWLTTSALAMAVDAGLFLHVVFEVGAQRYASAGLVPLWLVFAVDHVTFAGVGTAALFGAIAAVAGHEKRWQLADPLAAAGLVLGLAGVTLGLGWRWPVLETASAAVLGLSVLIAAAVAAGRLCLGRRPGCRQ